MMLHKTLRTVVTGLLLLGMAAGPVLAQGSNNQQKAKEIRTLLEQRDQEIKNLLQNKQTLQEREREKLIPMINGIIDFQAMSQIALGSHWNDLSAQQRNAFVDVFGEIVRSQSLRNLDVYRTKVRYDDIKVNGDEARVLTSVTYKDVPTNVEYVLTHRDGSWRVDDILLDEVSTAEGYARSFQPVIKKRGFDVLMNSLQKKLDKIAASS